jgi:hypothetical protein
VDASEPSSADQGEQEASVLGNLPRSRPSVRSPRREAARARSEASASADGDGPATATAEAPKAESAEPDDPPHSRERELEELARAGISLAGGAATLGLKAAGRAAAALRGAVERL